MVIMLIMKAMHGSFLNLRTVTSRSFLAKAPSPRVNKNMLPSCRLQKKCSHLALCAARLLFKLALHSRSFIKKLKIALCALNDHACSLLVCFALCSLICRTTLSTNCLLLASNPNSGVSE